MANNDIPQKSLRFSFRYSNVGRKYVPKFIVIFASRQCRWAGLVGNIVKMPHFRVETNVAKGKIPQDFVTKAVPILAKALGKPEQYCVVSVIPDVPMSFGGTTEPCAIANLMSIGALGVEQNKKYSKVLFDLVEQELGVPQNRMYITFQDEPTGNVGFKGTTFHAIFG